MVGHLLPDGGFDPAQVASCRGVHMNALIVTLPGLLPSVASGYPPAGLAFGALRLG